MAATNRRQLLTGAAAYAAGAAIVAGGAALASEAKGAGVDHRAWADAIHRWEVAEAAAQADDERYERLRTSWLATGDTSAECRKRFGVDAAGKQSNKTDDAAADAFTELLAMPSPNADALAWKLDQLFRPNSYGEIASWSFDYVKQTLADAVRLAGGIPAGRLA